MSNDLWGSIKKEPTSRKISMATNTILYLIVSFVSLFHAFKFFVEATEPKYLILAIMATVAFEIGQVAALFSLNTLNKSNKALIWSLFIFLTFVQVTSNIGYGFYNIDFTVDKYFNSLKDFFNFIPSIDKYIKHIVTFLYSGSLPIISLLFIKTLINYIAPSMEDNKLEKEKEDLPNQDFIFNETISPSKEDIIIENQEDSIDDNEQIELIEEEIKKEEPAKVEIKEEVKKEEPIEVKIKEDPIKIEVKEEIKKEEPVKVEIKKEEPVKVEIKEEVKKIKKVPNKNTSKVRIIDGENSHTFKDIDKSQLTIF
jgi:hypothetical protein